MTPHTLEEARDLPRRLVVAAAALILFCCFPARARQDELSPPKVEVKATVGASDFGDDDGSIPHAVVGGSVRFYVTRRLSVEPELLYMRHSPEDEDFVFTPSVAYDLTAPTKKVVPYLVAGVGAVRHRGRAFGADFDTGQPFVVDTSGTTWSAGFGAGVKIFLTDRLFVAPEGRIGREPTLRGTISVGYVISGRKRR